MKKFLKRIFPRPLKRKSGQRGYSAGGSDRLSNDWKTTSLSANGELRYTLKALRGRSRDLAMNNDYARRYLQTCVSNVVGPRGVGLQMRVTYPNGRTLDKMANRIIEAAWKEWGQRGTCTICGKYSWLGVQRLVAESTPRDGEILIEKVLGEEADNRFGYALNIVEADHLDEDLTTDLQNGNRILMGVEEDRFGRPIAYHMLAYHPGDYTWHTYKGQQYVKVSADRIVHVFKPDRAGQSRGVPWMHTAMGTLRMVDAYAEAELVAARAAASKMGFIVTPTGDDYNGDDKDSDGNTITEFEPGVIEQLPVGQDFKPFDPDSPSGKFNPFVKAMLQKTASGLGVAYSTLSSDLEAVNFSSIRSGVLEERQNWRTLHNWFIESLCAPIFEGWLFWTLSNSALGESFLPRDYRRLNSPTWQPRGWDWVDPLKDANANIAAIRAGTRTRTETTAERGMDFEDILTQLAEEEARAKELGLTLSGMSGAKEEAI
ncbi:MAG: phage portal protein [bacterium]|nr:phage portal protein [bacterium]